MRISGAAGRTAATWSAVCARNRCRAGRSPCRPAAGTRPRSTPAGVGPTPRHGRPTRVPCEPGDRVGLGIGTKGEFIGRQSRHGELEVFDDPPERIGQHIVRVHRGEARRPPAWRSRRDDRCTGGRGHSPARHQVGDRRHLFDGPVGGTVELTGHRSAPDRRLRAGASGQIGRAAPTVTSTGPVSEA